MLAEMNGRAEQWVSVAVGLDEARANDLSLLPAAVCDGVAVLAR